MTEKTVVSILESWLKQDGWTILWANHKRRGADVGAEKNGRRWLIETKGDAKNNDVANQDANFYSALGQIVAYRTDANAKYSVAFPDTARYRSRWQGLPHAARCAVDTCLFVSTTQTVLELSWSWP